MTTIFLSRKNSFNFYHSIDKMHKYFLNNLIDYHNKQSLLNAHFLSKTPQQEGQGYQGTIYIRNLIAIIRPN